MSLGPVMLGIEALELTPEERELLIHPLVGGVILFTRNYHSPDQLTALTRAIHALRQPQLLIAVDQEGGRVQRFREGFTRLPPPRRLGELFDRDREQALAAARITGWLMAAELRACGVDFSFSPVLDLDRGVSGVIGDRAFHREPLVVTALARAWIEGMKRAGMAAVGKHFPGHGSVAEDSHHEQPVDPRPYEAIRRLDMVPFQRLKDELAGMMPSHVRYPGVDELRTAIASPRWLGDILRREIGFSGAVFTDDLDMKGAAAAGPPAQRARVALEAGCDMVLACNDRAAARAILQGLADPHDPTAHLRLVRLHGRHDTTLGALQALGAWRRAVARVRLLSGGEGG